MNSERPVNTELALLKVAHFGNKKTSFLYYSQFIATLIRN